MLADSLALLLAVGCCVGLAVLIWSKLSKRKEQRRISEARRRLLEMADPIVTKLADYANRRDSALLVALEKAISEEKAMSGDSDDDDRISWLDDSPQEIILADLIQIQHMVDCDASPYNSDQFNLIRQFGAETQNNSIADITNFGLAVLRDESLTDSSPSLNALTLLAATCDPDRHVLSDLYSAFAKRSDARSSTHLPYALVEIKRAARTKDEIELEPEDVNLQQILRWADFSIELHTPPSTYPKVVGALAAYAERPQTGIADVVKLYEGTQHSMMADCSSVSIMLIDLCNILLRLSEDLPTPTPYQADLIKTFVRYAGRHQLADANLQTLYSYIEIHRNPELLGINALALMFHRDRFILRKLYVDFARKACDDSSVCKQRLVGVEQLILDSSMSSDEHSKSTEPRITARHLGALGILGVSDSASPEQIRQAYHLKAQLWHPDRLSGMADELQALATERLAELNDAYASLRSSPL